MKSVLTVVMILLCATSVHAGNGKISGDVRNAGNDEAIPGANVTVRGTFLGAPADEHGRYIVLNIPPGTYTVVASAVGFSSVSVKEVRVGADQSLTLDFSLRPVEVDIEEIIIEADHPVIDPARTSARVMLTSDDFRTLPIRNVRQLVGTSVSMYDGFLRGGRQYETKTFIDGVDVTDEFHAAAADQTITAYLAYNGIIRHAQGSRSSLVDATIAAVEEANIITGGVGSDYANASAGVVNYSLREGRGEWSGRAGVRVSKSHLTYLGPRVYNDEATYFRERQTLLDKRTAADSAVAGRYTYYSGKYTSDEKRAVDVDISLGGGIGEPTGLYASAELANLYGRLPNEFSRKLTTSLKIHHSFSPGFRITGLGLLEDRGRIFGWKNTNYAEDFRFFLEGVPKWDGVNLVGSMKITHVLSPSSFYELQASLVQDISRRGYSDDNNNGVIEPGEDGEFLTFEDPLQVKRYMASGAGTEFDKFFTPFPKNETGSETTFSSGDGARWKIARPGIFYEKFRNTTFTLKGDFTTQLTQHHQVRAGAQVRLHELDRTLRAAYVGGVFPAIRNYAEEIWLVSPKEFGVYVQDRMEYAGLIINLGFRIDALDLMAGDYANYFAPFRDDTVRNTGGSIADLHRVPVRGDNAETRFFFSPRVGVSHPIGEQAAMYFSFSIQQQSQPYSRLYSNYNDFANPQLPVITRVDQDPIKSTNYDLGVQWSFAEGYAFDASAYYKDIQHYGSIRLRVTPLAPWRNYELSTNFGYADSRGVELTIRKARSTVFDFLELSGRASYAYSYIKQAVFAGGDKTNFSTAGGDSATYGGQLPFADFRNFRTFEQNVLGRNSTLTGGYDRTHRIAFNLLLQFPPDIMISALGVFNSGFFYPKTLADPRARELGEGPWNKRVDLRVEKGFRISDLAHIALYVDIINAFNWTNVLAYHNGPVSQVEWERNGDPTGGPKVNRPVTQDGSLIYDVPRETYFGVRVTL